jgi:hypothetical protein
MAVLRIQDFSGVIPVTGDRALPDNFATLSMNTWLYGKELRGMRPPLDVIAIQTATRKVLRIPPKTTQPPSDLSNSVWKQFTDHDTDIVRGQLVEDQFDRWYFCSPTTGPRFNTYARMLAGQSDYKLGVPGPTPGTTFQPDIASISGGATPMVSRAYTYTWVNEFGEESAPAWPVNGSGNAGATWNISNIRDPAAPAVDQPAWKHKVLYRSISGASGPTTFYKVAEIAIGVTTYADNTTTLTDSIITNNLTLLSTSWQPPPATLKGWIGMPNGFLIGFDDNNVYMSESYRFHAWPAEYKQASEYPIVGLGVLGQTCVVCTQGFPATITGTKPATCSFTKATTGEPALGRGSIVSSPQGVIYASQNGLIMVGPGGIKNVTEQLITREEWIRDFAPAHIRAVRYQNGYLALRMLPSPEPRSGFFLDPTALKVALTELTDFAPVVNLNVDFWSGEVFLIKAGQIMRWDPPSTALMPVQWKSKEFQYPFQENFGAYAIYWDDARYSNANYGTSIMPTTERVRFIVYADRKIVYNQIVPKNGRGVRLPSGFKSDIWQFEIRARAPVYSLHVAATMKELKNV